jgi:hypothetical protein
MLVCGGAGLVPLRCVPLLFVMRMPAASSKQQLQRRCCLATGTSGCGAAGSNNSGVHHIDCTDDCTQLPAMQQVALLKLLLLLLSTSFTVLCLLNS